MCQRAAHCEIINRLRILTPSSQPGAPLAVISPGAGGTENGYTYLAEGLRDRGYLAVVMDTKESGPATLRHDIVHDGIHGGIKDIVTDSPSYRRRKKFLKRVRRFPFL